MPTHRAWLYLRVGAEPRDTITNAKTPGLRAPTPHSREDRPWLCDDAQPPTAPNSSTPTTATAPSMHAPTNSHAAQHTNAATEQHTANYAINGSALLAKATRTVHAADSSSSPQNHGTSDTPTTVQATPDQNTHTATEPTVVGAEPTPATVPPDMPATLPRQPARRTILNTKTKQTKPRRRKARDANSTIPNRATNTPPGSAIANDTPDRR